MRGVSDGAHRLQPHHQVFAILLGRQRPHRADRQLDVLHQLIGLLEREAFGRGARLELLHERLQPLEVLDLLLRPWRRDATCSCASSFCAAAS